VGHAADNEVRNRVSCKNFGAYSKNYTILIIIIVVVVVVVVVVAVAAPAPAAEMTNAVVMC